MLLCSIRPAKARRQRAGVDVPLRGCFSAGAAPMVRGRDQRVIKTEDPNQIPSGAAWPAITMDEAETLLCAADAPFAVETVTIRGLPTRTWKNEPILPNVASPISGT